MKVTNVSLSKEVVANFRGRFMLLVDQTGDGDACWMWKGPRHSSGSGRYLWRSRDGGQGRYVLAHRVAYWLATGELPRYLRNLCGHRLCVKPSHYWTKPTGRFKPTPRRAMRGRVRQLADSEIQRIRLLDSLGSDEDEVGNEFGLTKRQVAGIAMGRVRPEAGGRVRSSRFRGIRHYHDEFEKELMELGPEPLVVPPSPVGGEPQVTRTPNYRPEFPTPRMRPSRFSRYGQVQRRRLL